MIGGSRQSGWDEEKEKEKGKTSRTYQNTAHYPPTNTTQAARTSPEAQSRRWSKRQKRKAKSKPDHIRIRKGGDASRWDAMGMISRGRWRETHFYEDGHVCSACMLRKIEAVAVDM